MADASDNSAADAIEEAYQERVRLLFMGLATSLGDMPATHKTEQQCVEIFKTGFNTARKAKRLALDVVSTSPTA